MGLLVHPCCFGWAGDWASPNPQGDTRRLRYADLVSKLFFVDREVRFRINFELIHPLAEGRLGMCGAGPVCSG